MEVRMENSTTKTLLRLDRRNVTIGSLRAPRMILARGRAIGGELPLSSLLRGPTVAEDESTLGAWKGSTHAEI